jgi:hypothetical protein
MNSHGTAAHELWLCIQSTGASIQCGFLNVSFDPLMPNIGIIEHLSKSDMKWIFFAIEPQIDEMWFHIREI